MRQFRLDEAGVCVVKVHLADDKMCEIVTGAGHAMDILGGTTAIPARLVKIFDREGNRLSLRQLAELAVARP